MRYILLHLSQGEIVGTFFDSKEKCEEAERAWNLKYGNPYPNSPSPIRFCAMTVKVMGECWIDAPTTMAGHPFGHKNQDIPS
jgi:hypothetical protein